MDPQPCPLLHLLIRMKLMSTNVFLQVTKNVEVTRGKIWAVQRVLKCFPTKSPKLIHHQIGSMVMGVIMQKDDSVRQHSTAFWLYGVSQHPQPPRNKPHLPAFLSLPSFPMLDKHTLHYTHLQSNKEKTMWTCVFLLCMSPTLQMAVLIHNNSVASFCEKCVLWWVFSFHLTSPYLIRKYNNAEVVRATLAKVYTGKYNRWLLMRTFRTSIWMNTVSDI